MGDDGQGVAHAPGSHGKILCHEVDKDLLLPVQPAGFQARRAVVLIHEGEVLAFVAEAFAVDTLKEVVQLQVV